ncbi:MAG: type II secretion system F family protein [Reyranellaceae bacterium]
MIANLTKALTANLDLIIACFAALSAFLACLFVTWPHLTRDDLRARVRRLAEEREAIRIRERNKLFGDGLPSLRTEPKKFYKDIFDRFNLAGQAEDSAVLFRLRMAGYRGRGPVVTFVSIRVLTPVLLGAFAAVYVFAILQLPLPLFLNLAIVIGAALLGYYAPAIYLSNKIAKRQQSIRQAWPDTLDLMLICVESGMGIEEAFRKVADEIGTQSIDLAEELNLTTAELSYLPERRQVYENLAERTGVEDIRSAVTALLQADHYGTSVGQSLRVLAQESRDERLTAAEKKAAALPPKLTVPMILFFLPVLFAVVITPAAIQIMRVT